MAHDSQVKSNEAWSCQQTCMRLSSRRSYIIFRSNPDRRTIMPNSIGVGIVGAGVIGQVHANALQGIDGARIVAVAEPREDAGKSMAKSFDATVCIRYGSARQ